VHNSTGLHYAINVPQVIKFLLQLGADMNLKNGDGNTPLQHAQNVVNSREAYAKVVAEFKDVKPTMSESAPAPFVKRDVSLFQFKQKEPKKDEKLAVAPRLSRLKRLDELKVVSVDKKAEPTTRFDDLKEQFTTTKTQHETELENLKAQVKLLTERLDKYEKALNLQHNTGTEEHTLKRTNSADEHTLKRTNSVDET